MTGIFTICVVMVSHLLLGACGFMTIEGDWQYFDRNLRGTWKTNDPNDTYTGILTIDSSTITITGYGADQQQWPSNDTQRPFRDFPKNIPLTGYSEGSWKEGMIYIKKGEFTAEGISYRCYNEGTSLNPYRIMEIDFNGKKQMLSMRIEDGSFYY